MKFTNFRKALLMSALSAGALLCVTSCIENYSVGYLYVTGTQTSGTSGTGIVSGFKIDHNTGFLTPIATMPVSSGGANPVRAVLIDNSTFFYVLNRGVPQSGQTECSTAFPCQNANITQFIVGANGALTSQATYTTQGFNPFRMIADPTGSYIYVLEHDSPDNYDQSEPALANGCTQALLGVSTCGDITAFLVNSTTGRLSLLANSTVKVTTAASGTQNLTYFPVPANPVDFTLSNSILLTLSGSATTASAAYPFTGGSVAFPYTYNSVGGQLTVNQNSAQPLSISQGTAVIGLGVYDLVLDNEPLTVGGSVASQSQIVPYQVTGNGAIVAASSGPFPDDANQSNPIVGFEENKGRWFYVANRSGVSSTNTADGGITGYVINSPFQPTEMAGTPIGFGTGGNPQCMVEDPSNQYFYEANFNDSTVTAQEINEQGGNLTPLSQSSKAPSQYTLTGPPTWCLVDGRIN